MQLVQPLLRLAVLLVASSQGRVQGRPDKGDITGGSAPRGAAPRLAAPRYDFSRYFGGGGGDPGGGLGSGLGVKAAAAASEDRGAGFVEPVDFKSFFGGSGSSFGSQSSKPSPFFGASAQSGSRLPFGASPFGGVASAASSAESNDDFADFVKSKRGAGGPGARAQADEGFFGFDFPEGGGDKAALNDEDGEDRDEADQDDDRPAPYSNSYSGGKDSRPLKAGNARYPSYSSYYHTQPEQLRAKTEKAEDQDDDFGFDEDEPAGLTAEQEPSRDAPTSAEAYESRPFKDGASPSPGANNGPSRFSLQGGFVPSPVDPLHDPLRGQASQAALSSKAASHAAVHAAVRAAHRAASSHGKPGAGAGAALTLGAVESTSPGYGPAAKSQYVRRPREEPDDAFFEEYSGAEDREGDDYKFGPEYFSEDGDDDEGGQGGHAQQQQHQDGDEEGGQGAAANNCKKVAKKGSVCMVCTDPKTGGNYEQCQYATEPETQSYSFGRSSSYGNPRPKDRRRRRRRDEGQRQDQADHKDAQQDSSQDSSLDSSLQDDTSPAQRQVDSSADVFGEPLKDSHEKDHEQIEKELESSLEQLQGPKYEDYFSFLFPELTKEKSSSKDEKHKKKHSKKAKGKKKSKKKTAAHEEDDSEEVSSLLSRLEDDDDPFAAETTSGSGVGAGVREAAEEDGLWLGPPESVGPPGKGVGVVPKKDLERMLGEFQQKDRSDCTKVEKDKMTCYQCVDKKGMQHEECMFVAASEPKQSHLAYHQSSAFKAPGPPPKNAAAAATTTASPRAAPKTASASASNPAAKAAVPPPSATASNAKGGAKSRQQRAAEQAREEQQEEDDDDDEKDDLQDVDEEANDEPEGPQGLGQAPDDGIFTEETKPVYDKVLKMSLPKYMLDRSEDERVFDEVLAAGI